MKQMVSGLATFAIASLIGVIVLAAIGIVDVSWPWTPGDLTSENREVAFGDDVAVIGIEPLTLDCRARIIATVPVEGRKEHRIAGQVYRTDRLEMSAIGDIDTCVDATKVEVLTTDDGRTRVLVPADAVRFVRPRVDATAMLDSVRFDKGPIGKITDVFPWVSDSEGLTAAGYAFAQETIGSSECMKAAFDRTVDAMQDAYEAQARSRGLDPSKVTVSVTGTPDFDQNGPSVLEDFDFDVTEGVDCKVADGVGTPVDPVR